MKRPQLSSATVSPLLRLTSAVGHEDGKFSVTSSLPLPMTSSHWVLLGMRRLGSFGLSFNAAYRKTAKAVSLRELLLYIALPTPSHGNSWGVYGVIKTVCLLNGYFSVIVHSTLPQEP